MVDKIGAAMKDLPHYASTEFDPMICKTTLEMNCGQDMRFVGFVIANPANDEVVGGMSMSLTGGFVSRDVYVWDNFFWIDPQWRSLANAEKLFIACREWALKRGCKLQNIRASTTSGYKMDKLEKLMMYMGMEPIGTLFQYKEITRR